MNKMSIIIAALLLACGCADRQITVEWDSSTRRFVTDGVYARVKAIGGELALVYSAGPAVCIRTSGDGGDTWSEPREIARDRRYNYTNSELTRLRSGRLIYTWNARPRTAGECRYKIMAALSDDNGATWSVNDVYSAGCTPDVGCWEPAVMQLPDGELQLYFANEAPYDRSDEQEICMMRSTDGGSTWGRPERVSFRSGARDGMPVPVYLPHSREIAVAIEDNGLAGRFKPVIVKSADNWHDGTVTAVSPRRYAALDGIDRLHDTVYAGAPYLLRLRDGRTLLSVQSTEGRHGTNERYANMQVYAGDRDARRFTARTTPFPDLPHDGNALWNSLCQIDDDTVMAVMSVGGTGRNGIWTVKGRIVEMKP